MVPNPIVFSVEIDATLPIRTYLLLAHGPEKIDRLDIYLVFI